MSDAGLLILWIGFLLGGILAELVLRLPILPTAQALGQVTGKAARVMQSVRTSDHWKEKVLLRYSGETLRRTLWLLLQMAVILAVALGAAKAVDTVVPGFFDALMGWPVLVAMTLGALVYVKLRMRMAGV